MKPSNKIIKQPSFILAVLPLLVLFGLFIFYFVLPEDSYKIEPVVLILTAAMTGGILAAYCGFSFDEILEAVAEKFKLAFPAVLILLCIGLLVGSWMASGTIPLLIYYGLQFISPQYLLITAFVVTSIVSLCTGTSWGSASTIGVSIMGVAYGLEMNLAATAGAVIGGAYFGDKMSPLSDTTNMSSLAAGVDIYAHIRHMLYTTGPAYIVACIIFFIVGINSQVSANVEISSALKMQQELHTLFNFNIWLLIPPFIVLVGSVFKKHSLLVMLISAISAMIITIISQNIDFHDVIKSIMSGFNISYIQQIDTHSVSAEVQKLLHRGGINSMLNTTLYVIVAFAFGATLEMTGALKVIINTLFKGLTSNGGLVAAAAATGIICVSATGNSYISFIIMASVFASRFVANNMSRVNLSRTMEDAVTVLEGLMPWTVSGIFMASTLMGSSTDFSFVPWAVFNYTCLMFGLAYAFLSPYTQSFGIKEVKHVDNKIIDQDAIVKEQVLTS